MSETANWNIPGSEPELDPGMPNVLIGAPYMTGSKWLHSLGMDRRFRVSAAKNSIQELVVAAHDINPDAILLHSGIFSSAQEVLDTLQRLQSDVYLVLPTNVEQESSQAIRELSHVKAIYLGAFNWPEVTQNILAAAVAKRRMAAETESELWHANSGISAGMYNIVFWNRAGGTGRTTIAVGFAEACAARGVRTLLISLAAPCPLPYMLNLKARNNIAEWFARPSLEEGFQQALQPYKENLDVIVGLQDAVRERDFMQDPHSKGTINDLSIMAARTGYGVVVLDAPTSLMAGAGAAISAANYMVLVARPVIADIVASVEAFRLVLKNLSGQHVIKPGNVVCVLNRTGDGLLPQDSFHRMATEFLSKQDVQSPFPIIATTIQEDLAIQIAQNEGRSPLQSSDSFARAMHNLTSLVLGAVDKNHFAPHKKKKKWLGIF